MTYKNDDLLHTPDGEDVRCICADDQSAVFAPILLMRERDGTSYTKTIYKGLFVLPNDGGQVKGYMRIRKHQLQGA